MKISDKFSSDPEPTPPVVIAPPAPRTFGRELLRVTKTILQCMVLGFYLVFLPLIGLCFLVVGFFNGYFRSLSHERIPAWRRRVGRICDAVATAAKN